MPTNEHMRRQRVRLFTHPIRQITLQIPPEWLARIDEHAAARGVTRATLLREIIEAWLDARDALPPAHTDPP